MKSPRIFREHVISLPNSFTASFVNKSQIRDLLFPMMIVATIQKKYILI
jgi:hypothetical protein